ncbi:Cytochrome P450, E-class, group I [Parasponia andersonii]|uniref:Cytochrome P450, E-class, group I n=1 Tax=Parasponia andersonii TaxID=3476 RepID=A0A2P5DGC4_PARAD|nr:Cytochrome P450, E-class, group I [Parasponia andersonii]
MTTLLLPLIQILFLYLIPFISIPLYFLKLRKTINSQAKLKLPPGPIKLPLIGNLHQLVPGNSLPHQSLGRLSHQYGPIMLLQLGSIPTLVVSSAEMAKEIFKTHDVVFSGRPVLYAAKKLSYNCAAVSFAPYGDYWREIRKIVMLELLNSKIVQSFHAVREEEVKDLVKTISNSSSSSSSTYSFPIINLSGLALSLANNVLCRVAFRKKFNGYDDHENGKSRLREMLHETQDLLGGFCMADYFPWMTWLNKFNGLEVRLDKCFRELDSFYDEVIEEHLDPERPPTEHEDVVDLLLRVQNDPNQAMKINNDQIKGVLTDIFIAGTDTTSATIVWIMAELIKNPAAMRRAQEEVREVAKGRGKVEECELSKLNYLKLVIKEGFRLHPPAPLLVPRETTEFCRVRGYDVPSGTRVFVNAREIGRDSKYWDNPDEFRPERFLESSVDYRGQHFELLPFGAGRRGCPGINFGVVLIELALANLLCSFDWVLPHGMRSEDLDMEEASGLTVHKKIPLCLVAKLVYP